MTWRLAAFIVIVLAMLGTSGPRAVARPRLIFTGTFTDRGTSEGIYAFRFDETTGALTSLGLAAKTASPAWLALHPDGRYLYAANEEDEGKVSAYALDAEKGTLALVNQQSAHGARPCHLVVDPSGRALIVANYSSGTVAVLPIAAGGRLGEATTVIQHEGSSRDPERQKGPHAHQAVIDPSRRYAFIVDLGLDKVMIYELDPAKGTLVAANPSSASLEPGAGPRHLAVAPDGRRVAVINELSSTIAPFAWDAARGTLTRAGASVSTLPAGFSGENSTAEVEWHPSGRFLYGSNRGHDSIALFSADPQNAALTLRGHTPIGGRTPRHFAIDPTGRWLLAAGQASNTIAVFAIDQQSGALTPTGTPVSTPTPVCILFATLEPAVSRRP